MTTPFDSEAASLYGQFVQAAYTMCSAGPNNLQPKPSTDFPAGFRLAAWIQMNDFLLSSTGPMFYGFIAQGAQNRFIVAIRGTSNLEEWWDDLHALGKTPFKIPNCGMVADGFARIYNTLQVVECPPAGAAAAQAPRLAAPAGSFAQQVSALVRRRQTQGGVRSMGANPFAGSASVEITGHSLGAALATLYAMENAHTGAVASPMLCTFASPLVGDATFAAVFKGLNLTSWRVANELDLVTRVPPAVLGFVHVDAVESVDSALKVWPDPGCCHSLATYLSLIDPTKHPDAGCRIQIPFAAERPPIAAEALAQPPAPTPVFRPVAIDLYQGDDVEDTPGPLGGFARVKADGIAFLLHKASQGVRGVDSRYKARRAAWMSGGAVPVADVDGEVLQLAPRFAAYHFLTLDDPVAQAQHFLDTAQLRSGDDAVVDWEATPGNPAPSADAVDAFCKVVERALGFPMIVYSGNVAKEQLKGVDPRFSKRRLWLAQYAKTFKVQDSWAFPWLWQDNGDASGPGPNTIPGMNGLCDNSTIASPMTVKRLYAEWGGGKQPVVAPAVPARVSVLADARTDSPPPRIATPQRKIARYGWKPDLPDPRDYSYAVSRGATSVPATIDLRALCPPVYDQGQIGSCTANAIGAALEFDMMKQNLAAFTPSRLFIYYNERLMEGTIGSDAGANIRDGIKSVASIGDCPETLWPYDDTPALQPGNIFPPDARAAMAPSDACFQSAIRHTALEYLSIDQNLADMKDCLGSGYPFVFGFTVFPSFESDLVASNGKVPMPGADEQTIGGHAVMAVGYDDQAQVFIVRNSWGTGWGDGGYFYMPYAYLLDDNLADDFWVIRTVSNG
ncbi:MAG TPA: GH25 family lysozyme [Roseiarcus sp.]|nr:GH25 family lysozyme [Roseiarcus sp.]